MSDVVQLVALSQVRPALGARGLALAMRPGGSNRVQVAVRFLRRRDPRDQLVRLAFEVGIPLLRKHRGDSLQRLEDVGVVEVKACEQRAIRGGRSIEVAQAPRFLASRQAIGDGPVGVDGCARGPYPGPQRDFGRRERVHDRSGRYPAPLLATRCARQPAVGAPRRTAERCTRAKHGGIAPDRPIRATRRLTDLRIVP